MKMKYLLYGALALVGISAIRTKGFEIREVLPQLKATLSAIRKVGFSWEDKMINAAIDVTIKNPSNKALNVASAGAVTISKLLVYDRQNNLVATAAPNINALSIPAGGQIVLKNIPLESTFEGIVNSLLGGFSTNPDDYKIEAEINALGTMITV